MAKELKGLEEGPKAKIHIDLLRTTQKNIKLENVRPWWHTWVLLKKIHHHSWQTSTRNEKKMYTRSTCTRMDDQWKDYIYLKRPRKGTARNNYRPLMCLPMIWKMLTVQIREEIYFSLTSRGLFLEEQKGCWKGSRGTGELFYINQLTLNKSKTRQKNLAMAWIDNKKAYDLVPQSWIINCLKIYRISDES